MRVPVFILSDHGLKLGSSLSGSQPLLDRPLGSRLQLGSYLSVYSLLPVFLTAFGPSNHGLTLCPSGLYPCAPRLLVYVAEDLAADVLLASLGIGHDTLRRREDGDTQTVQYAGHLRYRRITAKTRTADTLQVLDGVGLGSCVPLQRDLDGGVTLLVGVELATLWLAFTAFLIRVRKSAIGSVIMN